MDMLIKDGVGQVMPTSIALTGFFFYEFMYFLEILFGASA